MLTTPTATPVNGELLCVDRGIPLKATIRRDDTKSCGTVAAIEAGGKKRIWSYSVKIGDLVQRLGDERLGIIMSEVFDFRASWKEEYLAVKVRSRHNHTQEQGDWIWQVEDIKVVSEA